MYRPTGSATIAEDASYEIFKSALALADVLQEGRMRKGPSRNRYVSQPRALREPHIRCPTLPLICHHSAILGAWIERLVLGFTANIPPAYFHSV